MNVVESKQSHEFKSERGALLWYVIYGALTRLGFDYPGAVPYGIEKLSHFVMAETYLTSTDYKENIRLTLHRSSGDLLPYVDQLEIAGSARIGAIDAALPAWGLVLYPQELTQPDHTLSFGGSSTPSICNNPRQLKALIKNIRTWKQYT